MSYWHLAVLLLVVVASFQFVEMIKLVKKLDAAEMRMEVVRGAILQEMEETMKHNAAVNLQLAKALSFHAEILVETKTALESMRGRERGSEGARERGSEGTMMKMLVIMTALCVRR